MPWLFFVTATWTFTSGQQYCHVSSQCWLLMLVSLSVDLPPSLPQGVGCFRWLISEMQNFSIQLFCHRHLRSANTVLLVIPSTCCTTLSDRAFLAAAASMERATPVITASPSLLTFHQQLGTFWNSHILTDLLTSVWTELTVKCPCNVAKCLASL